MSVDAYLQDLLKNQGLNENSPEMEPLRAKKAEVEAVLVEAFPGNSLTIRYGGSKAKNTMIRPSYDLDIVCYFHNGDDQAGESLAKIYENVWQALDERYYVLPKTSALRLEEGEKGGKYTHIDIVPGRYTDDTTGDVYLHQHGGDKDRLKTNLRTHIHHIRDSGLTDTIKLVKLWRELNGTDSRVVKTFILELLVVKLLSPHKSRTLEEQLIYLWTALRDEIDGLSIEDPANPAGNDLGQIFGQAKPYLQIAARTTLDTLNARGWNGVFGGVESIMAEPARNAVIASIPQKRTHGTTPWSAC